MTHFLTRGYHTLLFIPQRIDRIRCGRFDCLIADGQKGNDQGRQTGEDKEGYSQIYPIDRILEPFIQGNIGYRPGEDIG
jgi:hypothetical protein